MLLCWQALNVTEYSIAWDCALGILLRIQMSIIGKDGGRVKGKSLSPSSWVGHRQSVGSINLPILAGCTCEGARWGSVVLSAEMIEGGRHTVQEWQWVRRPLLSSWGSNIALLSEIYIKEYLKLQEQHMQIWILSWYLGLESKCHLN